jgi:hypothetical protein
MDDDSAGGLESVVDGSFPDLLDESTGVVPLAERLLEANISRINDANCLASNKS